MTEYVSVPAEVKRLFGFAVKSNQESYSYALGAALRTIRAVKIAEKTEQAKFIFLPNGLDVNACDDLESRGFLREDIMESSMFSDLGAREELDFTGVALGDIALVESDLAKMGYNNLSIAFCDAMLFYYVCNKMASSNNMFNNNIAYSLFKKNPDGFYGKINYFPKPALALS